MVIVIHRQYFCTNTCRRALHPLIIALLSQEMPREQRKLVLKMDFEVRRLSFLGTNGSRYHCNSYDCIITVVKIIRINMDFSCSKAIDAE